MTSLKLFTQKNDNFSSQFYLTLVDILLRKILCFQNCLESRYSLPILGEHKYPIYKWELVIIKFYNWNFIICQLWIMPPYFNVCLTCPTTPCVPKIANISNILLEFIWKFCTVILWPKSIWNWNIFRSFDRFLD